MNNEERAKLDSALGMLRIIRDCLGDVVKEVQIYRGKIYVAVDKDPYRYSDQDIDYNGDEKLDIQGARWCFEHYKIKGCEVEYGYIEEVDKEAEEDEAI
jgi:hypothetical protein